MLEQECLYADIDGIDPSCLHLLGMRKEQLICYLRIVPPGHHFKEPALGRIIVSKVHRGGNLGIELIRNGIQACYKIYPNNIISIEAQYPLKEYYEKFDLLYLVIFMMLIISHILK